MKLKDIAGMFNRAWEYAFNVRKFLFMFLTLIIAGLLFIFFQGIGASASVWLQLALRFFPIFVAAALLMATGTFLIKTYIEEKEQSRDDIMMGVGLKTSYATLGEPLIKAFYFVVPLLGAFIAFWILLALFILLKAIPYVGVFFGVILAFVPFLLNLAILLLMVAILGVLFFFTPLLAVKNHVDRKDLLVRLRADLFTHTLSLAIGFVPVWVIWMFVRSAAMLTFDVYSVGDSSLAMIMQAFFMLIPFAAAMSFPLIYFFNFALEAFLLTRVKNDNIPPSSEK